jgi:spermidine synthase
LLTPVAQRVIEIDGAAGTIMTQLGGSAAQHAYLAWDISSAAHGLRPTGAAAVIGVGGGRDLLAALSAGHKPVVGIELNDLIVDLHRNRLADFSGLSRLPDVQIIADEARSHLARDTRRYNVITMSLIDTWASTGAGAYSLSENGLYTLDAWRTFLSRLTPTGILSVSRWYVVGSPGETARMLALAMDTAWDAGADSPRNHIVLLQNDLVATLLLSPSPFSPGDVDGIQELAVAKGFNMLATPRRAPSHPMLRALWQQPSRTAMHRWTAEQKLDLTPPTDARPFFFNMLKPSQWFAKRAEVDQMDLSFLGNLQATQTLLYATLVSLALTLLTLVLPMVRRTRELRALPLADVAAALLYFALIGLGFMFVEMGLLSRLSVFLGHPTLALAVLLGGIIFFTGVGSLLSGFIDVTQTRWARSYPLIPALLVLVTGYTMLPLMQAYQASTNAARIMLSLVLLCPPALGLGLCFPLGLRLIERLERTIGLAPNQPGLGPWLWGINGAFGVCASGLALATSMVWGIHTTLLVGAGCYLLLPLLTGHLARRR